MVDDVHDLNASKALEDAIAWSFEIQKDDGHWIAECHSNATVTAQFIFLRQAFNLKQTDLSLFRGWIFSQQNFDGSWGLATGYRGDVSTSTEAYLALRLLNVPPHDPQLIKAKDYILSQGGVAKVRFFTRFFLASFGLIPWNAVPQLPAEFILLPSWFPVNIYSLSYWARATLIPLLNLRYHQPIYALPNGRDAENDYLDELWCDPSQKSIPYAPGVVDLLCRGQWMQLSFTLADKLLAWSKFSRRSPLGKLARKRCLEWFVQHLEDTGHIGGVWPPMHTGTWALLEEGYSLNDELVRRSFGAIEDFCVSDELGKRVQPTTSPVWDTVLMQSALCNIDVLRQDPRLRKTHEWILKMQLPANGKKGDWRIYKPALPGGGWAFQYQNSWFPDLDDTAVAVMALTKNDPSVVTSLCITRALGWILGMQNPDGGWGAFDWNNSKVYLNKIPFNDMNALCDPSTADVTGRLLECFGLLLDSSDSDSISLPIRHNIDKAVSKAIEYLLKVQEPSGPWWGRWGCNYTYGSSNVMKGISYFIEKEPRLQSAAARCIEWIKSCQNDDGGWGETFETYNDPGIAGQGPTTASQTAWTLTALLPYCPKSDESIRRGITWLIQHQSISSSNGRTWPMLRMTGTGFPGTFYIGYPLYEHYFPVMALTKFIQAPDVTLGTSSDLTTCLSAGIIDLLNRTDIVLMTIGSRGDVAASLAVAQALSERHDCRIRFAAAPMYQKMVSHQNVRNMHFRSVGGDPKMMQNYRADYKDTVPSLCSLRKGAWLKVKAMYHSVMAAFWASCCDFGPGVEDWAEKTSIREDTRPFLAEGIIANASVNVHVHCAEMLNVPLMLICLQPRWLSRETMHFMAYARPSVEQWRVSKLLSHYIFEIIVWLLVGSYVNRLRRQVGMKTVPWLSAPIKILRMNIPHLGLWSQNVISQPSDCSSNEAVVGYTATGSQKTEDGTDFVPSQTLEAFLSTSAPIVLISFGSQPILTSSKVRSIICRSIVASGIRAVVCKGWSEFKVDEQQFGGRMYITKELPHDWILPRVQAFIHHGGAGTTATAIRHAKPMLCLPGMLDQYLWAAHAHRLGLGPQPIRPEDLTCENFDTALGHLLSGQYKPCCVALSQKVRYERDGAKVAADSFIRSIQDPKQDTRCCIFSTLHAAWVHSSGLRLSGAAAASLARSRLVKWSEVQSVSINTGPDWSSRWNLDERPSVRLTLASLVILLLSLSILGIGSTTSLLVNALLAFFATRNTIVLMRPGSKHPLHSSSSISSENHDVVFKARIRRSEYDLTMIEQDVKSTCTLKRKKRAHSSLEKEIATAWTRIRANTLQRKIARLAASSSSAPATPGKEQKTEQGPASSSQVGPSA